MKASATLKKNHEFRRLYQRGKSAVTPSVVVYCRKNGRKSNRLGITTSVKLGKAVVRNRARRRLREVYRLALPQLTPGYDIILVARQRTADCPWEKLSHDFHSAVEKLGLIPRENGASQ